MLLLLVLNALSFSNLITASVIADGGKLYIVTPQDALICLKSNVSSLSSTIISSSLSSIWFKWCFRLSLAIRLLESLSKTLQSSYWVSDVLHGG